MDERDPLSHAVIGAALAVHRELGPGLLESVYEVCLAHELTTRGVPFETGVRVPVVYSGVRLRAFFRIDVLVGGRLVVELKSVEQVLPVHKAQLITYLKLTGHRHGLLINFNVPRLMDGITRLAK
jgi:GxxExxY protein